MVFQPKVRAARGIGYWFGVASLLACGDSGAAGAGSQTAAPAQTSAAKSVSAAAPSAAQSGAPSATASAATPLSASASTSASPDVAPKLSGTSQPAPTPTSTPSAIPSGTAVSPAPTPTELPVVELPPPAPGSADAMAADIDSVYQNATRFTARFVQKHKTKVAGVEREMKGVVFIERPNKISFRYDAPNKNRIVSDGSTLRIYIAEDEQMFEQPVKNTEYPGAFGFIMGGGIRRSFEFTFNEKAKFDLGSVLVGKPREANPQYEQVLFYVHKERLEKKDPGVVTGVLIVDAQGNRNRFEFFDASIPAKIDPAEFVFTAPPGTNVTK